MGLHRGSSIDLPGSNKPSPKFIRQKYTDIGIENNSTVNEAFRQCLGVWENSFRYLALVLKNIYFLNITEQLCCIVCFYYLSSI